jgi:hypothetical protein
VLSQSPHHEDVRGSGGNVRTDSRPGLLIHGVKPPDAHRDTRLGEPYSQFGSCGEQKSLFSPCCEWNPARGSVTGVSVPRAGTSDRLL